ncbi:Vms1/Ankzf1 family peptidyl-tRNA hydrolase [Nonomuraea sp. NPDC050328]|uniref:baeRF2 domain-containing protein n=1 Tax=Nonomuraea sp. NPDC050328 TaxID=3364361 RepID=UPI0037BB8487
MYLRGAEREQWWRSARGELGEADQVTLEALDKELRAPAAARALFAAHGVVVLAENLPQGPGLARWSPLPHVVPMLAARGENVPHLRVIVDRAGVELTVFGGGSPRHALGEATTWPLQKTAQGGWSRRTFERHAEEAWSHDLAAAATEIDEQVRRIGAELVIVAGEPRPRSALVDRLNTKTSDRVLMVEHGSRTDHGGFTRDVETMLDGWLERRRSELLGRHRDSDGPAGLGQVARVLREGRVHAVLMPGELPAEVWIGRGGTQLADTAEELLRWGVEEPVQDRADAALARAAAMTDAELWFCPELPDVAAVIRY